MARHRDQRAVGRNNNRSYDQPAEQPPLLTILFGLLLFLLCTVAIYCALDSRISTFVAFSMCGLFHWFGWDGAGYHLFPELVSTFPM